MKATTFKRSERLAKKKLIQELFSKGSSFYLYPFKVTSLVNTEDEIAGNQILISVPKRNHKTAIARNKIKRRIREAYRLNKDTLGVENNLLIAYIYTSKEILSFSQIQTKIISIHTRLSTLYQPDNHEKT